jgi:transposase
MPQKKVQKIHLFYDGAPWRRSEDVEDFLEENKDWIISIRLPKCSPEFNPLEEC